MSPTSQISSEFWENRRVLVTGHTGFKGAWLSLWLQQLGAEVSGLSLEPNTQPSLYKDACVESDMRSFIGDIRDVDVVRRTFDEVQPEIVLHLAAQPLVRLSYTDPLTTYSTNVMGTVHVLEVARHTPSVRAIVNVTSDKCYENQEWQWAYRETDRLGGYDPYSNSKACAELVTSAYRQSFLSDPNAPGLASARAGNVIGGGDWADDRLIPDLVRNALTDTTTQIRNPAAVRPWQHVLNPLSGYLVLAQQLTNDRNFADAWNFGPADEDVRTVREIADALHKEWTSVVWERESETIENPHEAGLLRVDSSRARSQLQWKPVWGLDECVVRTASWYRAFANKEDVRKITLEQLQDFSHDLSRNASR